MVLAKSLAECPTPPPSGSRVLICPAHRSPIEHPAGGMPWDDSTVLRCPEGCEWPVRGGIPRFTGEDYAEAFGLQWRRYQKTQLDSSSGLPITQDRLERGLGMPLADLENKRVLEVGCGAGRFTELFIRAGAQLVSADLSSAVDANLANCGGGDRPYLLVQANLHDLPVPDGHFDVVVCLGVLQHTPSPEESLAILRSKLAPGGILLVDHYRWRTGLAHSLSKYLTLQLPVRAMLRRMEPESALKATIALSKVGYPLRKAVFGRFHGVLDQIVRRLIPVAYTDFDLPDELHREWSELNTHDTLTDWYKHVRTPAEVRAALESLGLEDIWIEAPPHGGVIEARGRLVS
jgi:SAM-dependent methyltransferase